MAEEAVRVAVIGAGRMGRVHMEALSRSRNAEPVAVVDPVPGAREQAAAAGLAAYPELDALLAAGGFDAVLIAAPSDLHPALVTALARAGVPMLCEKPCGTNADEAREAARAAAATGTLLQIGYWRRFVPELAALRERIAGGELGDIAAVASHQWDRLPPSPEFRAHSGGIAVDMGVHEFDQVRWLLGQDLERIVALPAGPTSAAHAPSDPDAAIVLARLSGGTTATITLGRRFGQDDSCWFEAFGDRGYERCAFMWGGDSDRAFVAGMTAQAEAFADAVRGAPQVGADADDAVAALVAAERTAQALAGAEAVAVAGGAS
jgi:myo-inositol 2-dehydrogenase / D-chiro-inositol 1-dehydrogenase